MERLDGRGTGKVIVWLAGAACLVVIVAGLRFASYVVVPMFLAFMLAVLLAPIVRRLEGMGSPTWLAVVGVLLMAIVALGAFVFVVSVQLAELGQKLPEYQAMLAARLQELGAVIEHKPADDPTLDATAASSSAALIETVASALSNLLSGIVTVIFFLFLLCLLLASERTFARALRRVIPADRDFYRRLSDFQHQIQVQGGLRGANNLLTAVVLTALFLLFQIDFAVLWGLLALVLGFIPNIGLILACLPAVLLALIQHGLGTALVVLFFAIVLNAAVDNLVIPHFVSRSASLPMVMVFIGFIFWGWMFGLLGAIISTPATILVRTLLDSVPETRGLAQLMTLDNHDEGPAEAPAPRKAHRSVRPTPGGGG